MILRKWDNLPAIMKNDSVRYYYDILYKKRFSLICKRIFDFIVAIIILIMLSPVFIIISIAIKLDSKGPVFFRQVRVTQYGKQFKIFKFRTMIMNAEIIGTQVTVKNDVRITRVGKVLRKFRLDEFPQLFNIILGDMSFVGTRPEVPKYVDKYTDIMWVTLLLPAGVTSEASIIYKDEDSILGMADNIDMAYTNKVLVEKMKYNINSIMHYSFWNDIKTMFRTVFAVLGKENKDAFTKIRIEELNSINK